MEKIPEINLTEKDLEILEILETRLADIENKLKEFSKGADPKSQADDDDLIEDKEGDDVRKETLGVFEQQETEVRGSIKWIREHGDACAFSDCPNHVEADRRRADPASITCKEHMESEDEVFKNLAMGL